MEMNKGVFVLAFFITLFLLILMLLIGSVMNNKRYTYINTQFEEIYNNFNEMQTFFLMAETFGDEMACIAFEKRLSDMDKSIWTLGLKIDQYRIATEEFLKDEYYLKQKTIFNENQLFYLTLLKRLNERCEYEQGEILFFYKNSADCKRCDDQSYVLTSINNKYDEQLAIFSFDMDLNISTVSLLAEYYNVTEFPCLVIQDKKFCGMKSEEHILAQVCDLNKRISFCS